MPDSGQRSLGDFGSDRPAAEAAAVVETPGTERVVDPSRDSLPEPTGTVTLGILQVDYTIAGTNDEEQPIIHVFGRRQDGTAEHVRIHGFKPYFYAPADSVTEEELLQYDRITGWEETDSTGEPFNSIRGDRLVKIYGQTPRDVGQLRDDFEHYEADILFPNRFLIDKDIQSGLVVPKRRQDDGSLLAHHSEVEPTDFTATPRVCMLDIEVDDRRGFPEDGEEPIVCLTTHDSRTNEYIAWLADAPAGDVDPPTALPDYEPLSEDATIRVRSFDSEPGMLDALVSYIEQTNPDVLSGWNFTDFDAPYLLDRLDVLNGQSDHDLAIERLSRVNEVWRSDWGGPSVKGRVVFDLLYAYQRTKFTELDSYRLDDVGERELGVGKERYSGDIGDLWETDPEQLLEYNLRDVELCVELNRSQDIIPFWNEVRSFVGCKLEDATTPGDAVDMYVLHKLHNDFALPSKGAQDAEEYEGGAVFDPITGVRENVSVLDLKSLYPMCMVTTNASPETKVDPDEYTEDTYHAPNGTHFRKEPDGAIREMVDTLLAEREEKKALRDEHDPDDSAYDQYDRQQQAVKVIMNCFTPDTEVLTPAGVRGIRELEVGDEVYSLDPETMQMEVKQVTETHAYPEYRGELVDIQTSTIDFSVTPNHRMLVRKNEERGITEAEWDFVEAEELDNHCHYEMPHGWTFEHGERLEEVDLTEWLDSEYEVWARPTVHGHTFTSELGWRPPTVLKDDLGGEGYIFTAEEFEQHREYIESVCEERFVHAGSNRTWIPQTYDGDDFLELLAWYITEGDVDTSEPKEFGETYRGSTTVKIAQDAAPIPDGGESEHDPIGQLLDRMGFDCYVGDRSHQFTSELLGSFLREQCGEGSFEKQLPDVVFGVSEEQKRLFLSALVSGDGDRQPTSWRYTTPSEQLRDDVLRLCTHLGLTVRYGQDNGSWRIYCDEAGTNSFRMHQDGSESTADDGVYCVTVEDNNTLVAGRNGKFQNVSNSLYGVLGWDRFRLYDREMGAAVTATGREVIEFTEEVTNQLGKEVIYGDSVTGARPVVLRDPAGDVRILPIEELFERASDGGSTTLEMDAGGAVSVEAEAKEYRSLPGWEALSLSSEGAAQWQPIKRVLRHETSKDVLTLQHELGESTTTRDHAYVVEDEESGGYQAAPPTEVAEPVRVPSLPPVDQKETIDVYEVLDGYEREYEDGQGGVPGETGTKIKAIHADDDYVWFGQEHHGKLDGTPKIQRFINVQQEDGHALIRLLAAYIAEGSTSTAEPTTTHFGASISGDRRRWLESLRADYERLFPNVTASLIERDSNAQRTIEPETSNSGAELLSEDTTHKVQMMDELAAVFFREFAGQPSREKRVPSFVFHLPEQAQELFLDTLVKSGGSREFSRYSAEYTQRNFEFETTSRELAAGVAMLLIQRGETYSLNYRREKDSYTVQTCDPSPRDHDPVYTEAEHDGYVYDLSVAENENFVDGVGGLVLHNTDSVMLSVGTNVSTEEAIAQSFELEEQINDAYDEFARERLNAETHRFEIEFEKLYRRFFQAGKKKRYAGHVIWKEGKTVDSIDITGFEYQRSDIAPLTKEVQREVIERIVYGEDPETITNYLHEVIEDVVDGAIDPEEIAIPGGIGKRLNNYETATAQVRGAQYANLLLGTNFGRGSKPKRIYLDKVHPDFFERVEAELGVDPHDDELYREFKRDPDVICFEYADQLPAEFEVDWELMLEKTLKGPIERILEALDISWDEVRTGQEQTGLGQFM